MDAIIRAWQLFQSSKHLNSISLKELQAYHVLDELLNEDLDEEKRDECIKTVALIQVINEDQLAARDGLIDALTDFNTNLIKPVIVVKADKVIPISIYVSEEEEEEEEEEESTIYPVSIVFGGGDNS